MDFEMRIVAKPQTMSRKKTSEMTQTRMRIITRSVLQTQDWGLDANWIQTKAKASLLMLRRQLVNVATALIESRATAVVLFSLQAVDFNQIILFIASRTESHLSCGPRVRVPLTFDLTQGQKQHSDKEKAAFDAETEHRAKCWSLVR